ncbi:hypothetical protein AB3X96_30690 [Paraburkholderia sp. BR13439]|uniref:hypothetical protein n=1 Tax=Paraburkholderia sp. BR13439 TaxID=3236996 RepID=UPI0034CE72A0
MRYWWQDYLQQLAASRSTLIFGADLPVSHSSFAARKDRRPFFRYTDSAVVVGYGRGRFDSRQPVPAGLWRPWASVSASRGSIMQSYLEIAGRRAAFSICYEDFLWWPHWRLLIDRPDALISTSNEWFDFDLALAHIQQQSADSIARLGDVSLLRNRTKRRSRMQRWLERPRLQHFRFRIRRRHSGRPRVAFVHKKAEGSGGRHATPAKPAKKEREEGAQGIREGERNGPHRVSRRKPGRSWLRWREAQEPEGRGWRLINPVVLAPQCADALRHGKAQHASTL